jgi:sugar phosphate isomerase/epimerase
MRLAVSGHSFEVLPLDGVLAIAKSLDFKAIDISGFHNRGNIGFEPEDIAADVQGQADILNRGLDTYELDCIDFFPQFGASPDQHSLNDPDPAVRARTLELIRACAEFCKLTNTPGMTILPGVDHLGHTLSDNLKRSGEGIKQAVDIAAEYDVELRFEPHMSSVTDTPELAIELIETYAPGAKVTLDYSHFFLQYIPEDRVHQLIPYTGHVHVRSTKFGQLQSRHAENEVNWAEVVRRLKAVNYANALSIEYVRMDWFGCNNVDTLYETVATKEDLMPLVGRL